MRPSTFLRPVRLGRSVPAARAGAARRSGASARRGLTMVEIMVVLAIIALVTGVAIAGSMQLPMAKLRGSATMITSAIKVAYTRATATSRSLRLVMDLDHQKLWLEESDAPMLARTSDPSATGGAEAITEAERAALAEGEKILKGPTVPKPIFHPIEAYGFGDDGSAKGGKPLQRGITFRAVQTTHDDAPRTSGRAYLYFWPGGRTERASIQVRIGSSNDEDRTLSVLVSPLTGKVTVKGGAVDLVVPTEDTQSPDQGDMGF